MSSSTTSGCSSSAAARGRVAVGGLAGNLEPLRLEQRVGEGPERGVVIHDQHSHGHHGLSLPFGRGHGHQCAHRDGWPESGEPTDVDRAHPPHDDAMQEVVRMVGPADRDDASTSMRPLGGAGRAMADRFVRSLGFAGCRTTVVGRGDRRRDVLGHRLDAHRRPRRPDVRQPSSCGEQSSMRAQPPWVSVSRLGSSSETSPRWRPGTGPVGRMPRLHECFGSPSPPR